MYPPSSHHFHHTDVSCWSSQLSCFETCWTIFGRLDFCALNAGIDDRDDIFNSVGAGVGGGELPKKPDMTTFEVNLFGPYYGVKLAAHYMAKNTLLLDKNSAADKGIVVGGGGGKIIITASDAGLWALPPVPQYTATKHGIIGLVRALAPSALTAANISINAVAPALTPSNLAPPGLLDHYPQEALTKMETLMMAFDALGLFDRVGERGWGAMGPNGQVVEGRGDDIYFKEELEKVGGKEVSRGEFFVFFYSCL
jgi:15-hydroxyprostaglandin dehydrogenase (NAD)